MATAAELPAKAWKSALIGTWRCLMLSGRLGLRTFVAAPIIVALAVVPEAAQHVAEIKLGMFESKDAFRALASDSVRWAFGYAKIAGLIAAALLTARFWATGSVGRAVLLKPMDAVRLGTAIALLLGTAEALNWFAERSGSAAISGLLTAINWLGQALFMVMVAGALLSDSEGWRRRLFARLPTALLLSLLMVVLFVPLQLLHSGNHLAALGRPEWLVWLLMLFDSLVVGAMAAFVGAALFVGYRAGPTWRGWSVHPNTLR